MTTTPESNTQSKTATPPDALPVLTDQASERAPLLAMVTVCVAVCPGWSVCVRLAGLTAMLGGTSCTLCVTMFGGKDTTTSEPA